MAPLPTSNHYPDGVRLQALTMAECGMPFDEITKVTGISRSTIFTLKKKARERGYNPKVSRILKIEYVTDVPKPGRPKKINAEKEAQIADAL